MIDPELDPHLLSYNCFGVAIILEDRITVSVNAYKAGRLLERTLEHELQTHEAKLEGIDRMILVPYAAWVTENEIYYVPGRLTDHDNEIYVFNKRIIEPIIKAAIATVRGALLRPG
jgi:hypothetical protein